METKAAAKTFGDQRLAPGMYCLGGDALKSFVFKLDWESYTEDCNLGEALDRLRGASLRELDFMQVRNPECDIYIAGANEVKVEGDSHELRILRELLELTCKGVKPREATWFYYDYDGEKHLFFVLYAGKIVDDCYSFLNGFPLILAGGMGWAADDFGWYGHPGFEEAFERYWYRKFYTETLAGQLMVLSPLEPTLYHYTREAEERAQNPTPELLVRTSWVVIPLLAAIAFPSLRLYLAITSLALAVPWAFACWRILSAEKS
ncbi:MAG: hypothetical protein ACYCO5_06805 [Acidobacteriaceae bacterium]